MQSAHDAFHDFSMNYRHRRYHGRDALVVYIWKQQVSRNATDATSACVKAFVEQMHGTAVPDVPQDKTGEAAAEWIMHHQKDFVSSTRATYVDVEKEVLAEYSTELGNHADFVTYR